MSEDKNDGLAGLAGEAPVPVEVKAIPETLDSLEPLMRKTENGTPIKLIEEVLSVPKEHVTVRCIVYPDNDQRMFTLAIRGDSMIPRYRSTHEGQIKHSEIQYKMPDMKIEAPVTLDAEGNKVVSPEVLERLAKARKGRKPSDIDYSKVSDEITCSKCGAEKKLGKYAIGAKAKGLGVTIDEFLKTFLCSECNPKKRGRQASAKYAGLPTQVVCSEAGCGFTQKQHPAASEKAAVAAGLGFNEYIQTWKCKLHRAKKAHHFSKEAEVARVAAGGVPKKRGRQPNPLYIGLPRFATCIVCKKTVPVVPAQLIEKANILGITVEQLVANYKCTRNCRRPSGVIKVTRP